MDSTSNLTKDMRQLIHENSELHKKMTTMQAELMNLLHERKAGPLAIMPEGEVGLAERNAAVNNNGELATLLAHNNALVLQELQDLKRAQEMQQQQIMKQSQDDAQVSEVQQPLTYQSQYQYQQPGHTFDKPPVGRQQLLSGSSAVPAGFSATVGAPPAKAVANVAASPAPQSTPHRPAFGGLWTPQPSRLQVLPPAGYGAASPMRPVPTAMAGPQTPHGKAMMHSAINQMNLPPEEWAGDVRDLHAQLIECLEQLFDREQELEAQSGIVAGLEESLVAIKQQMSALYFDYADKADLWSAREKQLRNDNVTLNEERDDSRLKLRRMQEMADLLQREDKSAIEAKLAEQTRKITVYEVNEAILSRKYVAQSDQLAQEMAAKAALEHDFVEMETALKRRILYLEQHKLATGSRVAHLQGKLDTSVSQNDYLALQAELEVGIVYVYIYMGM